VPVAGRLSECQQSHDPTTPGNPEQPVQFFQFVIQQLFVLLE